MTKSELTKSMIAHENGSYFITKTRLARFLGVKRADAVGRYVNGLSALNERYFYIPEVSQRIIAEMKKPPSQGQATQT